MKQKIKDDLLNARKSKDDLRKSLLGVLLGEIQLDESRSGKEMDDSGVVKHIKKLKKSCDEMYDRGDEKAFQESKILDAYLPTEMSALEIVSAIRSENGLIEELVNAPNRMRLMGKVKAVLDKDGRPYDGKMVSVVIKEI